MATIKKLELTGYNDFLSELLDARPVFNALQDLDDVINELRNIDQPYNEGVQTNFEAWEIVAGECNVMCEGSDSLDFSECATSFECLVKEANLYHDHHVRNGFDSAVEDLAEQIHHAIETACELGYEGDLKITHGSVFGWAIHNRETIEGCAIYDDEEGHCYPNKLEGELYAVEHCIGGQLYMSACWNPELKEGGE